MLLQHQHTPGEFDPGHCRTCARQAGLLDHYDRVQREETRLRQTSALASAARRYALWVLGSSGAGIGLVSSRSGRAADAALGQPVKDSGPKRPHATKAARVR